MFTNSDGTKPTYINEGLMNNKDVLPSSILITSSATQQSVLWMGTKGNMQVKKVIQLTNDKLYFTTSVVIKNIGSTPMKDFYCEFCCCEAIVTSRMIFNS